MAADLCGVNGAKITAEELGQALRRRFPHTSADLEKDLANCEEAAMDDKLLPKEALALVQALSRHQEALEAAARAPATQPRNLAANRL
jgi:hypothetical protein